MTRPGVDGPAPGIAEGSALVARCRAGDETAWRELFDRHFPFVRRLARRLGTPEAEMDDVCQDVFFVVFRKLDDFHAGRFTTWLYRIVANVASQRHRTRRVRRAFLSVLGREPPDQVGARPAADAALERAEVVRQVNLILERLPPKKRLVFALYELDGLGGAEIAEIVGCPMETVRTRLHYARLDFARLARETGLAPGEEG